MLVRSWHCHNMKSDRRLTPDVRTRRSSGGSVAVKVWAVNVEGVMVLGEG